MDAAVERAPVQQSMRVVEGKFFAQQNDQQRQSCLERRRQRRLEGDLYSNCNGERSVAYRIEQRQIADNSRKRRQYLFYSSMGVER